MRFSLESLGAFAARAHKALTTADVAPRGVLAYRIRQSINHSQYQRRAFSRCPHILRPVNADTDTAHDSGRISQHLISSANIGKQSALPNTCPGCGALSQVNNHDVPGFYSTSRKTVKLFLRSLRSQSPGKPGTQQEPPNQNSDIAATSRLPNTDSNVKAASVERQMQPLPSTPLCDRCHNLVHNACGQSIAHPTLQDIADSIAESPFKRNHVYHVLDAADFPMSLVPNVGSVLTLAQPRSQNRRSQHDFSSRPTLSYIITRSDLLGPTKEMVDTMMPYFQSTLRKAMGRDGRSMRLGNVHLVSAKRGWWSSEIKDSIWKRGGGNWLVGKVNVGKSNLFEVLFPKGSGERAPVYAELEKQNKEPAESLPSEELEGPDSTFLTEGSLLPPPQTEVPFPVLPVVSSLPGTTVSPIRLSFGGRRGELVDLPGLERGILENFVQDRHARDLVMDHRPNVTQHVIKPGQSLVLGGGLVRITPKLDANDPSTTMLAYPFVPLDAHVTSTQKAESMQRQERQSGVGTILGEDVGSKMHSAGIFVLDFDITKARSGPLLRAGVSLDKLPFRVYSTDLLIEGVGWVELVCQVRRRKSPSSEFLATEDDSKAPGEHDSASTPIDDLSGTESDFAPFLQKSQKVGSNATTFIAPQVEVFSPLGKHIGHRQPLGAWAKWTENRKQKVKAAAPKRIRNKPS